MDLCYQHPEKVEIVHNERDCPLCSALDTIDDLTRKLEDANNEIKDLASRL
jgi:hypothetical protein